MADFLKSIILIVVAQLCFSAAASAERVTTFERPPTLAAHEILDPKLFTSKNYRIDPVVKNDGCMNLYLIHSAFGKFSARGTMVLESRLQEVDALVDIKRQYPSEKVLADSAVESGKEIVTAPIRAVGKAVETVSDREKLQKTAEAIPGGVLNLFSFAADAVTAGADFVAGVAKSAAGGGDKSVGDSISDSADFISDAVLDYAGYNKAARELYKAYQLDPYTNNTVLRNEIRRVASLQSSVRLASRFAPGIPGLPYVGTFNRYVGLTSQVAAYDDPKKLESLNEKLLRIIGTNERQKPGWSRDFERSKAYTPLTRALILDNLDNAKGVDGKSDFLSAAAKAKDHEGALFYVSASAKLLEIHRKKGGLRRFVNESVIVGGVSRRGILHVPLAVDHLVWTKDVSPILVRALNRIPARHPAKEIEVLISGTASARAKAELKALGATTIQESLKF